MDLAITKMSSKGQIVIPAEVREDIKEGDRFVVIRNDNQIILKKIKDISKNFKEDIEFAKRTDKAFERYKKGKFKKMNFDQFIAEIKKW